MWFVDIDIYINVLKRTMISDDAEVISICLEANSANARLICLKETSREGKDKEKVWALRKFVCAQDGLRLIEELIRRLKDDFGSEIERLVPVVISLPGIVTDDGEVKRASRLGILEQINPKEVFYKFGIKNVGVYRDVDCLARGELLTSPKFSQYSEEDLPKTFLFMWIDEGVGSSIYINGSSYRGAGFAGPIGRLIVEKDGAYNPAFQSHGPLEVFVGRPFISQEMINLYLSEREKKNQINITTDFRHKLEVACLDSNQSQSIKYQDMIKGWDSKDPIAVAALDKAANYLGLAISTIITILNPPIIILSGNFIRQMPSVAEHTIAYAKRYSWQNAWNSTEIFLSEFDGNCQHVGAAWLYRYCTRNGK